MGYLGLLKFSFKKLTALIGRDKLVAGIEKARADGDLNWAAELAAYLVSYDLENQESKNIKAEIFEVLGSKTINATWRNAYMSGAHELRLAREDGFSNDAGVTLKFDNKGSMVAVLGGADHQMMQLQTVH